jgi:hypothetical protein
MRLGVVHRRRRPIATTGVASRRTCASLLAAWTRRRRRTPLAKLAPLALLVLCALVTSSCGSSKAVATPPATRTESNLTAASVRFAIGHCRQAVAHALAIPPQARAELEFVCSKVVDRIGREARELREVVCNELADASSSKLASVQARIAKRCEVEAAG